MRSGGAVNLLVDFLIGLSVGFLMCIPVGPINLLVISAGMKHGFWPAMGIALGGAAMDFVFFFLLLSGLALFSLSQGWQTGLQLSGIAVLIFLGVREIFRKADYDLAAAQSKVSGQVAKAVALGAVVYVANPTLYMTMSWLAATLRSLSVISESSAGYFAVSLGLAVGGTLWFGLLLVLCQKYRKRFTTSHLAIFNKVAGWLMIVMGLYFGYQKAIS